MKALQNIIRYIIIEEFRSPYRGGLEKQSIYWNFWKYFDDAVDIVGERKAANHAKKETLMDLRRSLMDLGRSPKMQKIIEKLHDATNEAYLDIQRYRSVPGIDLSKHWTRKFEEIKV